MANRDSAVFWNSDAEDRHAKLDPVDGRARPSSVFFHRLKKKRPTKLPISTMYQYFLKMLDIISRTRVGSGREPPRPA